MEKIRKIKTDPKIVDKIFIDIKKNYQKIKLKKINLESIKEDVHWTKEDQWVNQIK
jgi:hypothetical protein